MYFTLAVPTKALIITIANNLQIILPLERGGEDIHRKSIGIQTNLIFLKLICLRIF